MERNTFFCNLGLYIKSVLVLILLLGGSGSAWAQESLPYSYGFENNNLATDGWTTNNLQNVGTYKSGIAYSSYTSRTGTYHFRFYSNENPPQYLISPLLAESENSVIVSLYYKNSMSKNTESFCVGYATVSSTPSTSDFTWATQVDCNSSSYTFYEHTFPANARYIAIKSTTTTESANIGNNYYLMIDDISIVEDTPYKTPTEFVLSSYDATSATFSWTAGNNESTWQFDYSTNPDFTPGNGTTVNITTNPYTLTGLSTGTTYYASIRADYGSGNYSDWTDKISFVPANEVVRTVNDGSSSLYYIPFYYNGVAQSSGELYGSQFIIPKGDLDFAKNRQINKLVFYASAASKSFGNAEFEVYLKETDNSSFSSNAFESWGTCVVNSSKLSVDADKKMEIEFDTPFNYSGNKNLMIGFKQKVKGSNASSFTWVGVSATNACYYYYGEYGNRYSYLPKVTITTVPVTTAPVQMDANGFTTFASSYPLDLREATQTEKGFTAYKATVDAGKSIVRFTSDINQTVQANTGILLKGKENTTYLIPVVASGSALEDNALLVNEEGGTFTADEDSTYFAMKKNSNPLTFGTFDPSTTAIPSNKAYLKVLTSSLQSGARTLRFVFDDNETTGIKNVDAQKTSSKDIYFNLNGQRVAKPTKGMYISNGKKYIVK